MISISREDIHNLTKELAAIEQEEVHRVFDRLSFLDTILIGRDIIHPAEQYTMGKIKDKDWRSGKYRNLAQSKMSEAVGKMHMVRRGYPCSDPDFLCYPVQIGELLTSLNVRYGDKDMMIMDTVPLHCKNADVRFLLKNENSAPMLDRKFGLTANIRGLEDKTGYTMLTATFWEVKDLAIVFVFAILPTIILLDEKTSHNWLCDISHNGTIEKKISFIKLYQYFKGNLCQLTILDKIKEANGVQYDQKTIHTAINTRLGN